MAAASQAGCQGCSEGQVPAEPCRAGTVTPPRPRDVTQPRAASGQGRLRFQTSAGTRGRIRWNIPAALPPSSPRSSAAGIIWGHNRIDPKSPHPSANPTSLHHLFPFFLFSSFPLSQPDCCCDLFVFLFFFLIIIPFEKTFLHAELAWQPRQCFGRHGALPPLHSRVLPLPCRCH